MGVKVEMNVMTGCGADCHRNDLTNSDGSDVDISLHYHTILSMKPSERQKH